MRPLRTKVNTNSASYKDNLEKMTVLVAELSEKLQESLSQGSEKHINRAKEAGKFTARERLELLLDQDSPFMELLPLAGLGGDGFGAGGTIVAGIGLVSGKLCMINSNIGTKKGGAIDYATLQKGLRLGQIALENSLPMIILVESAGAKPA